MGDLHKVIKAKDKKFSDACFEQLLRMNPENYSKNRNPFFTRPAYAYTIAEVGGIGDGLQNIRRVDSSSNVRGKIQIPSTKRTVL